MKFLLDTDHISIIQLRSGPEYAALSTRVAQRTADLAFCVISFHEQMLGAHSFIGRARRSSDVVRGYKLIGEISVYSSRHRYALRLHCSSEVFDTLRAQKIRVPTMDLRLAAICTFATLGGRHSRSISDFGKIPGYCYRRLDNSSLIRHPYPSYDPEFRFPDLDSKAGIGPRLWPGIQLQELGHRRDARPRRRRWATCATENISFQVEGPATYEQNTPAFPRSCSSLNSTDGQQNCASLPRRPY